MTQTLGILERLFRQECRSLTQYTNETSPWVHRGDGEAQSLLQSIISDERRWAEQLAEMIIARGGQPIMGSYPDEFVHSNLHFVALDYLLTRVAEYLERVIANLKSALSALGEDSAARLLVGQMIERKTGQVQAIGKLQIKAEPVAVHA